MKKAWIRRECWSNLEEKQPWIVYLSHSTGLYSVWSTSGIGHQVCVIRKDDTRINWLGLDTSILCYKRSMKCNLQQITSSIPWDACLLLSVSQKSITADHIDTYSSLLISFIFGTFVTFVWIPNMIELFIFYLSSFLIVWWNKMPQTDSCLGGSPGWSPTFEKREKVKERRTYV